MLLCPGKVTEKKNRNVTLMATVLFACLCILFLLVVSKDGEESEAASSDDDSDKESNPEESLEPTTAVRFVAQ